MLVTKSGGHSIVGNSLVLHIAQLMGSNLGGTPLPLISKFRTRSQMLNDRWWLDHSHLYDYPVVRFIWSSFIVPSHLGMIQNLRDLKKNERPTSGILSLCGYFALETSNSSQSKSQIKFDVPLSLYYCVHLIRNIHQWWAGLISLMHETEHQWKTFDARHCSIQSRSPQVIISRLLRYLWHVISNTCCNNEHTILRASNNRLNPLTPHALNLYTILLPRQIMFPNNQRGVAHLQLQGRSSMMETIGQMWKYVYKLDGARRSIDMSNMRDAILCYALVTYHWLLSFERIFYCR